MRVQLSVTAQNTWSDKFSLNRRAQISIVQGTTESTVTLRRYDPADGTTVIQTLDMTEGQIVEVVVAGLYDVGVATGNFGSGTCLITVEQ